MIDTLPAWLKVLELIGSAWTQDAYARDVEGNSILPESDRAVCWCLQGAIIRVADGTGTDNYYIMVEEACRVVRDYYSHIPELRGGGSISYIDWQDVEGRTLEEVLDFVAMIIEWKVMSQEVNSVRDATLPADH